MSGPTRDLINITTRTNNSYGALICESESGDSETSSIVQRHEIGYQQDVIADCQLIEDLWTRIEEDIDNKEEEETEEEENREEETINFTLESLEALCAESILPLHEYNPIQLQLWK